MVRDVVDRFSSKTLTIQVAEIQSLLRREGVPLADMRGAQALELIFAGVPELGMPSADGRVDEIERFEQAPVTARRVPEAGGASRLRFFLDGSQQTRQVWRLGVVPIATTIAAAAILERSPVGEVKIAPGTLRFSHAWLIPRRAAEPDLPALVSMIEEQGGTIVDPLDGLDDDHYERLAGDYAKLLQAAYVAARHVREGIELELLDDWGRGRPARHPDDWLVVDGRLRLVPPRAIGLVKSLTQQYLMNLEAMTLFDLPPGFRTTAFRRADDRRRDPGAAAELDAPIAAGKSGAPTLWYLRLRDAAGQDARHALVRVEAHTRGWPAAR